MLILPNVMEYRKRLVRHLVLAVPAVLAIVAATRSASAAEVAQFDVIIARASNSGSTLDKRLLFAKKALLSTGYKSFTYLTSSSFQLTKDQSRTFPIERNLSAKIQLKGVTRQNNGDIAQYYLEFYSGKKREAGVSYSIWKKGAPGITALPQPGGLAFIIIVRALQ